MALYEEMKASVQQENSIEELEKRKFSIIMADYLDDTDYKLMDLIGNRIKELKGDV